MASNAKTSEALLPTNQDYKWVKLKQYIYEELRQYKSPRLTEIVAKGRKLGLDGQTVRRLVQAEIPEYRQTTNKIFKTSRPSRHYAHELLGQYSMDLAFFSRASPEMSRIGQRLETGALIARDSLSRFTICVGLQKDGKSAKGLEKALQKLLDQHAAERDYKVRSIFFDAEPGMRSIQIAKFLAKNGIRLHIYTYSRVASAHSESIIRVLRTYFERWRGNPYKWQQACHLAAKNANELPIRIRGKQLSFAPVNVTSKTLGKFLGELYRLKPEYYYTYFSIDTTNLKYKFKEKDTVSLKIKSFSTKAIGEKRSEQSVDEATWEIKQKLAYYSDRLTIIKCYLLKPTGNYYGAEIVAEEDALVRIEL